VKLLTREGNILEPQESAITHVDPSGVHGENEFVTNHSDIVEVPRGGRVRKANIMLNDYVKA
jgi:hypothetical protein